jgi:hypothetical protein
MSRLESNAAQRQFQVADVTPERLSLPQTCGEQYQPVRNQEERRGEEESGRRPVVASAGGQPDGCKQGSAADRCERYGERETDALSLKPQSHQLFLEKEVPLKHRSVFRLRLSQRRPRPNHQDKQRAHRPPILPLWLGAALLSIWLGGCYGETFIRACGETCRGRVLVADSARSICVCQPSEASVSTSGPATADGGAP